MAIMSERKFYEQAAKYWAKVPATIDGVLGGYGYISPTDIEGSRNFLLQIFNFRNPPERKLALDCGAGIGRVSKELLVQYFDSVDLVEQDVKFVNTAKFTLAEYYNKLGTIYTIGLQDFKPQKRYDVIWCQWILGHLTDLDLITFLSRCCASLNNKGVIVIKDNIAPGEEIEYDEEDSSVTRPLKLLLRLTKEAKLTVVASEVQEGFPDEIYSVHMFALVPMPSVVIV